FEDILGGGNWMTGLAIGVGALVVLPLAAPILRPLAQTAIKGARLWRRRQKPHERGGRKMRQRKTRSRDGGGGLLGGPSSRWGIAALCPNNEAAAVAAPECAPLRHSGVSQYPTSYRVNEQYKRSPGDPYQ